MIETVFDPLPAESKARKKEQDHRRKIKEKLMVRFPEYLMIDNVRYKLHGIEEKQYTNTILVTSYLDWWRKKVRELFSDYEEEERNISRGDQIIYRDTQGEKVLTISFYPSKEKMMVQGNHEN